MTFVTPAALGLLAAVPPILWLWLRRPRSAVAWPGVNALSLPPGRRPPLTAISIVLRAVALGALAAAVAGPIGASATQSRSLILAVDVSGSMAEADFTWHDETVTRLEAARRAIRDFIASRPDDRIGLVPFAAHPEPATPPTADHASVLERLSQLQPRATPTEATSNLGDAIALALGTVRAGPDRVAVVVISDGEQTVPQPALTVRQAGQLAAALGVPVYAIDPAPEGVDAARMAGRANLEAVAALTGGRAFAAADADAMTAACHSIERLEQAKSAVPTVARWWCGLVALAAIALTVVTERCVWKRTPPSDITWSLVPAFVVVSAVAWPGSVAPSGATASSRDLVIALDASRSMLAPDAPPSRFAVARTAVVRLIDSRKNSGGRVELIVFAARPTVWVPLTSDLDSVIAALDSLDPAVPPPEIAGDRDAASGTRIGLAIRTAVERIAAERRRYTDVLLLSDGDDPAGDGEWQSARSSPVPVHAIGIGNPDRDGPVPGVAAGATTRLHETPLREIAAATGGVYHTGHAAPPDLVRWHREIIGPKPAARSGGTVGADQSPWGYLAAFGVTALAMIGVRRKLVALAVIAPAACSAGEPPPFERGCELARLGRHREAAAVFGSMPDDPAARYNHGTSALLASAGRDAELLREAVASLNSVRDWHADARTNLELAKRLLAALPPESRPSPEPPADTGSESNGRAKDAAMSGQPGDSGSQAGPRTPSESATPSEGFQPGRSPTAVIPDTDVAAVSAESVGPLLARELARIRAARRDARAAPATRYPDW